MASKATAPTARIPHFIPAWEMQLYAELVKEVEPYEQLHYFRSRQIGYTGSNDFWKVPSPEPKFTSDLRDALCRELSSLADSETGQRLYAALSGLSEALKRDYDPQRLLLVAILRAGVPIADWLRTLLPGSEAVMASLFIGAGIDRRALAAIQADFPERTILFVDGWTGKGGVARTLAALGAGELAVLVDPWQVAGYRGTADDLFCPSALFTGPTTLGFSRSFIVDEHRPFQAYRFPTKYVDDQLVQAWRALPSQWQSSVHSMSSLRSDSVIEQRPSVTTELRIHANEVCRALINSNPEELLFRFSESQSHQEFHLLIQMAHSQEIPIRFDCAELASLRTTVACRLKLQ